MAKSVKKKQLKTKGKNIRFSDEGHELLSSFCKERSYILGSFCENAALGKMREEKTKGVKL